VKGKASPVIDRIKAKLDAGLIGDEVVQDGYVGVLERVDLMLDALDEPRCPAARAAVAMIVFGGPNLVAIGDLDVVSGELVIPSGSTGSVLVDLIEPNFFGPVAVRLLVTSADNPRLEQRVDVTGVEINRRSQLRATIPSDTWAPPAGTGVAVPWGVFARATFLEVLYVHMHNANDMAVRALLNVYGDGLHALPPGIELARPGYSISRVPKSSRWRL
jgi:hypothetical protein